MPALTSDARCPTVTGVDLPMAYLPAAPELGVPKPFCLAKTELTGKQRAAILDKSPPSAEKGRLPKGSLSWDDAQELLSRLNELGQGARFRLPTEAEWISAARFGQTQLTAFTFGDDEKELVKHGNCESEGNRDEFDGVAPVASFEPNAAGLFDLHGNLAEWVADGAEGGAKHIRLGGSFEHKPANCQIGSKGWSEVTRGQANTGLRVAAEPLPPPEG